MSTKLPFMQFYPADWIQDTQVLSLEAQGAWIKILCALHIASVRGRQTSATHIWKQYLGYPQGNHALELIAQLREVADIELRDEDGNVCEEMADSAEITIVSRRMVRDEAKRNQELARKRRYDDAHPTRRRRKSDAYISEVRSQNTTTATELVETSYPESGSGEGSSGKGVLESPPRPAPSEWNPGDVWLKDLIESQPMFANVNGELSDCDWWADVSEAVNGLNPEFITRELAKMSAYKRERPEKWPTRRGMKRFVRGWLERAKQSERRYGNGKADQRR